MLKSNQYQIKTNNIISYFYFREQKNKRPENSPGQLILIKTKQHYIIATSY
jgi:hypothetical protein